jgi:superfamily II DNA or RNA helicase/uncharacterized protein (DUF934 family)
MRTLVLYPIYIFDKYKSLLETKNSEEINNFDLALIFEWYCAINLSEETGREFFCYTDIDANFKEDNQMSIRDTGIDLSDMKDTIVQCKLRSSSLSYTEVTTFFASQVIYDDTLKTNIIRWKQLIITRNNDCKLSSNLQNKSKQFIDKTFSIADLKTYCNNLINNPPERPLPEQNNLELRDYQNEAVNIILQNKQNSIINLPTGTGKTVIIASSLKPNKKYLILVPRIFLLEQIKNDILHWNPAFEKHIELIGDKQPTFSHKNITICVYNSIEKIPNNYIETTEKIFVDEAHHIYTPMIYEIDDDDSSSSENSTEIKQSYIDTIRILQKHNNNVYLSATIDPQDGFIFYSKNIRDMINLNYLADYIIKIPIFNESHNDYNHCKYLIMYHNNIIIFARNRRDGQSFTNTMNKISKNSCQFIDCNTTPEKRKHILENFKSGKVPFLVNVRVLSEGFDAPITKGVFLLRIPSSDKLLLQIIGRALRKHPEKIISNIILPLASTQNDTEPITKFMRIIAKNDPRIKKSYQTKKIGGYINFITPQITNENEQFIENNDIEFKFELIYDSMGNSLNLNQIWLEKLDQVKSFIHNNGSLPREQIYEKGKIKNKEDMPDKEKEEIKLGQWLNVQKRNYKGNKKSLNKETRPEERKLWEEFMSDPNYKKYFINADEIWLEKFNQVKSFIHNNGSLPRKCIYEKSKNKEDTTDKEKEEIKLGHWLSQQKKNYKGNKYSLNKETRPEERKLWDEFISDPKYKKYFINADEIWLEKLDQVKSFIHNNGSLPRERIYEKGKNKNKEDLTDKEKEEIKLGKWLSNQKKNYKGNKESLNKETRPEERKLWEEFISDPKYKKYFINADEIWLEKLDQLKSFIHNNESLPRQHIYEKGKIKNKEDMTDEEKEEIKLGSWLSHQKQNYKGNKESLNKETRPEERKLWEEFMSDPKYKKYV